MNGTLIHRGERRERRDEVTAKINQKARETTKPKESGFMFEDLVKSLDSRFRGNNGRENFRAFGDFTMFDLSILNDLIQSSAVKR
jgi:hypothetical protein